MAAPVGPKKVKRYSDEFKIQAVRAMATRRDKKTALLCFPSAVKRDPAIERWMDEHPGELGAIARRWFEVMRGCGDDVRELLHDGYPTACVGDAAFRPGCSQAPAGSCAT